MAMENSNECVRTWLEVATNGLNDSLYYQKPSPFNFKTPSFISKKEKESLNDEDRCDECKAPFDTITLIQNNALCSTCAYPFIIDQSEVYMNLADFNNHLVKVETLLYKLSGKQRVSVKWFLPLLTVVMNNWKIYTGLYEIGTLLMISHSWRLVDLVNVQEVVTILRKMRDDLKLNMKTLL
jgi:hypothetical protein